MLYVLAGVIGVVIGGAAVVLFAEASVYAGIALGLGW